MESQTKISNIDATDDEKIEALVATLEDAIGDQTSWIMICGPLFECFLLLMLGAMIAFVLRLINKLQNEINNNKSILCDATKNAAISSCNDRVSGQEQETTISH